MAETRIFRGALSVDDMLSTLATNTAHEAVEAFRRHWYETPLTWSMTSWRGHGVMKAPTDLWAYHDIIHQLRPRTIIETGTAFGGSALWFADLLELEGIGDGVVISVDLLPQDDLPKHPRIAYITGSSVDPAVVGCVASLVREGPMLVSLDSEHTESHVAAELDMYAPFVPVGSALVVEDTNVTFSDGDGGPGAGLRQYLARHEGEWARDILCERYLLTMHPGGWLRRIR